MRSLSSLSLLAAVPSVLGDKHYFFSGFFAGSTIAGIEFDDSANSLTLVNNITAQSSDGSKWIAIDERKENVYVATTGEIQSYAVTANKSLEYKSNITLSSSCQNANFIAAANTAPYTVFGVAYSTGCAAQAITVDDTGSLQNAVANLTYNTTAGVHGLDLSPDAAFIYSADDMGNAVWVHSYNSTTQAAAELQYLAAPEGANPRHLAVHPNGKWVYVIYEEANSLAVYARDTETGLLTDKNTTYSLLPAGFTNTSSYWADEVKFSLPAFNASATSPKYLITGTRSRTTSLQGYVSAFALDATTGGVTEQLFLLPTTSSGGSANAVAPAPFSEEYFAITDSGSNFVEVWKMDDEGMSAASVAHLGLGAGPANVVWVN
ncbi:uncharacterized protein N0V89_007753 [Didymosphaeria variabile]|uniref:3-carboxy-cis,cis-mucoante lactonizing enzyme n=1 Tax=Didymosphaeria variabile TaxID=1932322 RepID=A0A9W9CAH8_9PLEO|nr:uncharacterized protein N0V89_007753 [Didymosphaeria variabile]KAJ4352405.1 hypothetical protein N0V89_007753 [Didymosphaeria variabile]